MSGSSMTLIPIGVCSNTYTVDTEHQNAQRRGFTVQLPFIKGYVKEKLMSPASLLKKSQPTGHH
ncbi:hypothetical protein FRX31_008570 [Thalictrum thalictroides]|uniref:Uncharacterized protein n=1 Tax=Thalictrum thalictroides TaxID=46969 RepID=A0A7J6X0B8_THATH|nr:hypothetical protein FRX31_008570 [Thalictrum thalictroides]